MAKRYGTVEKNTKAGIRRSEISALVLVPIFLSQRVLEKSLNFFFSDYSPDITKYITKQKLIKSILSSEKDGCNDPMRCDIQIPCKL